MKSIHIGSIIEQKVKEQKINISDFAKLINRSRTTVYDIFQRKSIDIDLLLVISKALDFDFLTEIYVPQNKNKQEKKYFVAIEVNPSELPAACLQATTKKIIFCSDT